MTPIALYDQAWARCDQLSVLHGYLAANLTSVLQPDEILRAEWAARVSALDLYIHELVAQRLVLLLSGSSKPPSGLSKFQVSAPTVLALHLNPANAMTLLDLEVRSKLERCTFQYPADIADGIRFISDIELWNEVAVELGANQSTKTAYSKSIRSQLTQIVGRRNKIVHEADLQPGSPRVPWPISVGDLQVVSSTINGIVKAIDKIV